MSRPLPTLCGGDEVVPRFTVAAQVSAAPIKRPRPHRSPSSVLAEEVVRRVAGQPLRDLQPLAQRADVVVGVTSQPVTYVTAAAGCPAHPRSVRYPGRSLSQSVTNRTDHSQADTRRQKGHPMCPMRSAHKPKSVTRRRGLTTTPCSALLLGGLTLGANRNRSPSAGPRRVSARARTRC